MTTRKVSLKDIAGIAGVSPSVVSMVLNGNGKKYRISDEVALRVRKIAKELNYQPNFVAKSLRVGKTGVLGLVVSDISNAFFANLARCVENYAEEMGYSVVFASSDENAEKSQKVIDVLVNKGVDGLIVVPCDKSEESVGRLKNGNVPFVLIDRTLDMDGVSSVCLNNKGTSFVAAEYLINKGYTKTGVIAYDTKLKHMQDRVLGYRKAMEAHGLGANVKVGHVRHDRMRNDMAEVFGKMLASGVDSFLFASNAIAIEGLKVINTKGLRVPEDIGVVVYDGGAWLDLYQHPIPYVQQPVDVMAQKGVQLLVEQITSDTTFTTNIELMGRLVTD